MTNDEIIKWIETSANDQGGVIIEYIKGIKESFYKVSLYSYVGCGKTLAEAIEDLD